MSSTRPCGSSADRSAGLVDARDEEVLVGVRDPEQLVAHGAADDVGVEAERADVAADRGRHEPDSRVSRGTRSLQVRDGLDLDERARRELGDLERRSRRRPVAHAGRVHLVHRLEVVEVD